MQLESNDDSIKSISKSNLLEASKALSKEDISQLIKSLSLKDDKTRYNAFLLLQTRSSFFDDVYPYWDTFRSKLKSDNSYQRNIGLNLIAENAKWDTENRMEDTIDEYLTLLYDEKPITIRQCIQSLGLIASVKPNLNDKIASRLIPYDIMAVRETMRKPILLDILSVLPLIRNADNTYEIENFILKEPGTSMIFSWHQEAMAGIMQSIQRSILLRQIYAI